MASSLQPKDPEPHLSAGPLLEKQNKYAEAEQEYRQALAKDPNSPEALIGIANIYMRGTRFIEAAETLRKLVAQRPDYGPGHIQLARVLAAEKKFEEAIPEFQAGLKLNPADKDAQRDLAEVYASAGKFVDAQLLYEALLGASPNDAALHHSLGRAYMRAVSVRVNEVVAVAGFVVPGTRVDVLLTGSPGGTADNQTTTVLENIAVLAAGQKLERNAAGEPQSVPVITLLVSPEDAQKLTLASQEGRIQLSLRNPLDTNQQKLPSVRNAVLYGASAPLPATVNARPKLARVSKPAPASAPPSPYTIEVIRGQEKKEIKFDQ